MAKLIVHDGSGNMEAGIQTGMGDFVVTEKQAEEIDELKSAFFSAKSNTTNKFTFSSEPMDDKESPDGKCITGRLVKQMVPIFDNGKKTDKMEEVVIRQMVIDTLNGKPCKKIWRVKSRKMRDLFKVYADNQLLAKKVFILEIKGELKDTNYVLTALDKPGN